MGVSGSSLKPRRILLAIVSTGSGTVSTGSAIVSTGSDIVSTGSGTVSTGSVTVSTGSVTVSTGSAIVSTGSMRHEGDRPRYRPTDHSLNKDQFFGHHAALSRVIVTHVENFELVRSKNKEFWTQQLLASSR